MNECLEGFREVLSLQGVTGRDCSEYDVVHQDFYFINTVQLVLF